MEESEGEYQDIIVPKLIPYVEIIVDGPRSDRDFQRKRSSSDTDEGDHKRQRSRSSSVSITPASSTTAEPVLSTAELATAAVNSRPAPFSGRQAQLKSREISLAGTTYVFGPVKGPVSINGEVYYRDIPVGSTYMSRNAALSAGIHKHSMAGIVGSQDVGSPSICMNGGYADNQDHVYTFTYTGASNGGTGSGDAHTDQSWSSANRALFKSYAQGYPVRVLRGSKADSTCAPDEGYRYDGLFQIIFCWIQRSISSQHYKVIKFAFQRLPGQEPISRGGRVFKEDEYIKTGLTRDWIKLPDHYVEVPRNSYHLVEPSIVDLGDGLGTMTPAEWEAKHQTSSRTILRKGSTVSRARAGVSMEHLPYRIIARPPPLQLDIFGSVIEQKMPIPKYVPPPKPVIQKIVRTHDPYSAAVHRKLCMGMHDYPGYGAWADACIAAGKVIDPRDMA